MHIVGLVLAVVGGLMVLAGYFVPPLAPLQRVLLSWCIIIAGAATIVGIFNLVLVHGSRIHNREKGSAYSAVLLIFLFASLALGLMLGPDHPDMHRVVDAIIVPAESSLMALLAISLLYACIRLLRRRASLMGVTFIAVAVLMLVASATLPFGDASVLNTFARPWIQHVLGLGGARGLLIGVALGTLVTGLRIISGTDRPYQGA